MKQLPINPNIEFLRKQAKRLLSDFKPGKPDAIALINLQKRAIAQIDLRETQNLIARSYGFNDWADLAMFVQYRHGGISMKNRINWFWIPVENLDRASEFYKHVLNCEGRLDQAISEVTKNGGEIKNKCLL